MGWRSDGLTPLGLSLGLGLGFGLQPRCCARLIHPDFGAPVLITGLVRRDGEPVWQRDIDVLCVDAKLMKNAMYRNKSGPVGRLTSEGRRDLVGLAHLHPVAHQATIERQHTGDAKEEFGVVR